MFPPLKARVQRPDPCSSRTPPAGEDLIGLIGCDRIGRRPERTRLGLHPTGGGRPYSGDSAILIGCDRIGPPETDPETDPGIMRRSGPLHPTDRIFYTWHFLFSCAAAGRVWGTVVLDFRGTVASGDIDSVYPSHRDLSGPKQRPGPPAGRNAGESPTEARSRTISDRAIP